jgi:hypothetical protein
MIDLIIADPASDSSPAEASQETENVQKSQLNPSHVPVEMVLEPNPRIGMGDYDDLDLSAMIDDSDLHPSFLQPRIDDLPQPQTLPSPRSQSMAVDDGALSMPKLLPSSEPAMVSKSNSSSSDENRSLVGASRTSIGGGLGGDIKELRFSVEPDVETAELLPLYRRQRKMQSSAGSSRDGTLNISSVRDSISLFSVHGTDLMGSLVENATFAIDLSLNGLAPELELEAPSSYIGPSLTSSSLGYFVLISIPGLSLQSPDDPSHDVRIRI